MIGSPLFFSRVISLFSLRRIGGMLGVLLLAGCSPADPLNLLAPKSGFSVDKSVRYMAGARGTLDVYRPDNARNAPVIVFFYGGNWDSGSKDLYFFLASAMARRGFVIVVPDYRIYPEVKYPTFIEDSARAVAWAKGHAAQYGGDPNKFFIMGHSAGAHTAAMLDINRSFLHAVGLDPARDVKGWIGVAGPYDFLPLHSAELIDIFGGPNNPDTQPITYVKGGEPPALLIAPRNDNIVDPGNTARLAARMRSVGDKVKTITYDNVGHITIVGAFSGALSGLAPIGDDVAAFVNETSASVQRSSKAR